MMTDLGRYLSAEPLLQRPWYVKGMARRGLTVPSYAYALNNPLTYADRSGNNPVFIAAGIAAIVILISDVVLGEQDAPTRRTWI